MKYKLILFTLFISWITDFGFSQTQAIHNLYFTIPEIAILDIEPNTNDIILDFNAPIEAGDQLETLSDNTKWINYTSTVTKSGLLKNITAQIVSSIQIPGFKLELIVSNYSGGGRGVLGTPVGIIDLTTTAQTIITGIGGCYTNTGTSSGHRLEYKASINDYSIFEIPVTPTIDIIYTISN